MNRTILGLLTACCFLTFFAACPAWADTIYYKDGSKLEGTVLEVNEVDVVVQVRMGTVVSTVRIPRSEVARIVRGPSSDEQQMKEYRTRLKARARPNTGCLRWLPSR